MDDGPSEQEHIANQTVSASFVDEAADGSGGVRGLAVEDIPEDFVFNDVWKRFFMDFLTALKKRYNVAAKVSTCQGKFLAQGHFLRKAVADNFYNVFTAYMKPLDKTEIEFNIAKNDLLLPTQAEQEHDEWVEQHLQANAQALLKRMENKLCTFSEEYRGAHSTHAGGLPKLAAQVGRASIRAGLEQLLAKAFSPLIATASLLKKDLLLKMQLQRHAFVMLQHLDIPTDPPPCNEMVLSVAAAELRRINSAVSPAAKIAVLVKTSQLLFNALNLGRARDSSSRPGADDFLPILIYVVLKAKVVNLCWHLRFIETFRHQSKLQTKEGYFLASLQSAVQFLVELSETSLTIDPDDYKRNVIETTLGLPERRKTKTT